MIVVDVRLSAEATHAPVGFSETGSGARPRKYPNGGGLSNITYFNGGDFFNIYITQQIYIQIQIQIQPTPEMSYYGTGITIADMHVVCTRTCVLTSTKEKEGDSLKDVGAGNTCFNSLSKDKTNFSTVISSAFSPNS